MASGRLIDYLGYGLASARPTTPTLHTGVLGIWWSTDTEVLSVWDGATWESLGGAAVDTVNGAVGTVIVPVPVQVAVSDETTDLTTGAAKVTFRMPFAMTLTAVRASVVTAPTGSALQVDINVTGTGSILSTPITIDDGEKTSVDAATPPVISTSTIADDAEVTIDIDQIGSTTAGTGLKVTLIGYKTP